MIKKTLTLAMITVLVLAYTTPTFSAESRKVNADPCWGHPWEDDLKNKSASPIVHSRNEWAGRGYHFNVHTEQTFFKFLLYACLGTPWKLQVCRITQSKHNGY